MGRAGVKVSFLRDVWIRTACELKRGREGQLVVVGEVVGGLEGGWGGLKGGIASLTVEFSGVYPRDDERQTGR